MNRLFLIVALGLCWTSVVGWTAGLETDGYAWVLTEVKVDDVAEKVRAYNKNNAKTYRHKIDAMHGGINLSNRYIGKGKEQGEHLAVRVEWSRLPDVIEPGSDLEITLNMEATSRNLKHLTMSVQARIDRGTVRTDDRVGGWSEFKKVGDPGTNLFFVNSKTGFKPVSEKVSNRIPSRGKPNDRIAITISAYNGLRPMVSYIYTWKEPGPKANEGFVPNANTAIKIAEAILYPIYGNETLQQRPFRATLEGGDVWVVTGTNRMSSNGAVSQLRIQKSDCRILEVSLRE